MSIQINYAFHNEMLGPISLSLASPPKQVSTSIKLFRNQAWGSYSPFQYSFLFRGIGFRAIVIENSWQDDKMPYIVDTVKLSNPVWQLIGKHEFPFSRYLILRVGHSFHFYVPIPSSIGARILKKDRKLIIYGSSIDQLSMFSKYIIRLRSPSVYTGRGIRLKGISPRRKLGKKDVRKGRFF